MKRSWMLATSLGIATAMIPIMAQPHARSQAQPAAGHQAVPQSSGDGDRVFKENCSRCHDAPQGFSPRISRTVVLHMRVRASLSAADEKQILKFLNP
jgi:cytochrome c5